MRFRHGAAERAAAVIWLLACLALGTARWWLLPVLLLPLLAVVATLRRGTDFDADGVTVHAVFGSRRLPWSDVAELRPSGRRAVAVSKAGRALKLPTVTPADLLKLTR